MNEYLTFKLSGYHRDSKTIHVFENEYDVDSLIPDLEAYANEIHKKFLSELLEVMRIPGAIMQFGEWTIRMDEYSNFHFQIIINEEEDEV